MDIKTLSCELEEIIREKIGQGSMFSIAEVTEIWGQSHPDMDFKKAFTKLLAEEKISLACKTHCEYHP